MVGRGFRVRLEHGLGKAPWRRRARIGSVGTRGQSVHPTALLGRHPFGRWHHKSVSCPETGFLRVGIPRRGQVAAIVAWVKRVVGVHASRWTRCSLDSRCDRPGWSRCLFHPTLPWFEFMPVFGILGSAVSFLQRKFLYFSFGYSSLSILL